MIRRDRSKTHQGRRDREAEELGSPDQFLRRSGCDDAAACIDDRFFCAPDQVKGLFDLFGMPL